MSLGGRVARFGITFLSVMWPPCGHCTSVVFIISKKGDYAVVGADSRIVDKKGPTNNACKIIALGGDTLFFESGIDFATPERGESWNSRDTARAVYKGSKTHNTTVLSTDWAKRAIEWFSSSGEMN
jgi:hypothetical protein